MITPETAMRQAAATATDYFTFCLRQIEIEAEGKNISDETKFQCASRLALAASIDYATAAFTGSIQGYDGVSAKVSGSIAVENIE